MTKSQSAKKRLSLFNAVSEGYTRLEIHTASGYDTPSEYPIDYHRIAMPFVLMFFCLLLALPLRALEDFDRQQIIERIRPIGKVHVEGQPETPASATAMPPPEVNKVLGQATYENHCMVCHADGVAGAPKFRDAADWEPRLAKSNLDELKAIAIKGINAMPPKGTCGECSEEDIKNAIQYMLPRK